MLYSSYPIPILKQHHGRGCTGTTVSDREVKGSPVQRLAALEHQTLHFPVNDVMGCAMPDQTKTAHSSCKDAVMAELIAAGYASNNPVNLYLVGPTLVAAGFTEQQIVSALDSLEYERRIEYTGGNRVRLT